MVNPNIALGYQGIQLENPLNAYGKVIGIQNAQQQNALAQLQMETAMREREANNALNEAYKNAFNPETGQIDQNALLRGVAERGQGRQIPGIQKSLAEMEKASLERQKGKTDLIGERMKLSRMSLDGIQTPEEYIAWHEANHKDPILGEYLASRGITADQARANIMRKLQQPGGFQQLLTESKLGAEKAMEQHFSGFDTGAQSGLMATPKYGGGPARVVAGSVVGKVESPDARSNRETARLNRATDLEMKLADDYRNQSKNFKEVSDAYSQISKTLDKASTSPAATLAAATKFMKLLDPGSVVRESELGMALAASGVIDRAFNYYNVIQSGKVLTKQQAADFKNITQQIYQAAQESQQQIDADYMEKARQYGLRPEMVVQRIGQDKKPPSSEQKFTGQDKEALDWANANPKDPRAAKIKERLGVK